MKPSVAKRIVRGNWRTRLIAALAVVAALMIIVILLDAALSLNRVHAGVSISGHEVGRMTRAEAVKVLDAQVAKAEKSQIILTDGTQKWPVLPTDLKVNIDVASSVEAAMAVTRSSNVFSSLAARFELYFSRRDVALKGTVDTEAMDALLADLSQKLDVVPINAGLKVENGDILVVESKDGVAVDKQALRDSLKGLLLTLHATELPIPKVVTAPDIKADDTSDAVATAKTIISGAVTLKNGDKQWTLSAQQIESALDFTVQPTAGDPAGTKLVPFISKKTASLFLADITNAVKRPSKNATWTTDGDTATLVPSVNATTLDVDKTLGNLNAATLKTTGRVAQVVLKEVPPDRTTEKAKAMGIEVPLGSYTTDNHGDNNRMRNVIAASKFANNVLVAPGEEFDYNEVVNSHTKDPGVFYPAPAIQPDGSLKDEIGGGICQVSTTLFNAVFFTGLEVLERYNHTNYISSYPLGRDATVTLGGANFRFRNDMNHWILIKAYADEAECTFVIYGTDEGRKVTYTTSDWYDITPAPAEQKVKDPTLFVGETKVKMPGQTGKSVKVVRSVTLNGEELHHDVFVSEFPARPKITLEGTKPKPGTTTTTTKPGTTTTTTKPGTTTTTKNPTTTTTKPTTTTTKKPTTTTAAGG